MMALKFSPHLDVKRFFQAGPKCGNLLYFIAFKKLNVKVYIWVYKLENFLYYFGIIFKIFSLHFQDAEFIRRRANETKVNARKLRDEADQLNHRVKVTENDITHLEESSNKDDNLVDDAKRKVISLRN